MARKKSAQKHADQPQQPVKAAGTPVSSKSVKGDVAWKSHTVSALTLVVSVIATYLLTGKTVFFSGAPLPPTEAPPSAVPVPTMHQSPRVSSEEVMVNCEALAVEGACESHVSFMDEFCAAECKQRRRRLEAEAVHNASVKSESGSASSTTPAASSQSSSAAATGVAPDRAEHCAYWASTGECQRNARYMSTECATSCASPNAVQMVAGDSHQDCAAWVKDGECYRNPAFMLQQCKASCARFAETNANILQDTSDTCVNFALEGGCDRDVTKAGRECRASCHIQRICGNHTDSVQCQKALRCEAITDKHADCEARARRGECGRRPRTMLRDCLKSCSEVDLDGLMHFHLPHRRTILSPLIDLPFTAPPVAGFYSTPPGRLNTDDEATGVCRHPSRFLARLNAARALRRARQPWGRQHWHQRQRAPGRETSARVPHGFTKAPADPGSDRMVTVEQVSYSPRIRYLHQLLTPEECEHLIRIGDPLFSRSPVRGSVTRVRTSSTAMLRGGVGADPVVRRVRERISRFSGYADELIEPLQIVRYHKGQKYEAHHDFFDVCDLDDKSTHGRRQMTFLVYLADMPEGEAGGGTAFPELNIAVQPERGSAVVFNDCLDNGAEDGRSLHEALPPLQPDSVKYAITCWIRSHPVSGLM